MPRTLSPAQRSQGAQLVHRCPGEARRPQVRYQPRFRVQRSASGTSVPWVNSTEGRNPQGLRARDGLPLPIGSQKQVRWPLRRSCRADVCVLNFDFVVKGTPRGSSSSRGTPTPLTRAARAKSATTLTTSRRATGTTTAPPRGAPASTTTRSRPRSTPAAAPRTRSTATASSSATAEAPTPARSTSSTTGAARSRVGRSGTGGSTST